MMSQDEFRDAIDELGLSQLAAARFLGVAGRTTRRWASGEISPLPRAVELLLRVMLARGLTPKDVLKIDAAAELKADRGDDEQ